MKISRRRLADYVKTMHQKACRTCSTIIFLHSTNQIIDLRRCRWRCRRQILNSLLIAPRLPIPRYNANNMKRFTNSCDSYFEVMFQLALPWWSSLIYPRKQTAHQVWQLSAHAQNPKTQHLRWRRRKEPHPSRNRLVGQRGWHHTRHYMTFSLRFTLNSFLDTFPVPWRSMEVNSFQSASQWRSMFDFSRWWRRCLSLFSLLDRIMKSLSPLFGGDTLAFGKAVIKQ